MKNKHCLILTGGDLEEELIRGQLEQYEETFLICVDGALVLADKMGLTIDYLVGDFDTAPAVLVEKYKTKAEKGEIRTKIRSYCSVKDETDTQIAIAQALESGAETIVIMGATGSRMDHALANIQLLLLPLKAGKSACLLDKNNKIYLKDRSFCIKKDEAYGEYFSLIPFLESVKDVTLTGFQYNTEHVDFSVGTSLGVSNRIVDGTGSIEFPEGIFIVIEAND